MKHLSHKNVKSSTVTSTLLKDEVVKLKSELSKVLMDVTKKTKELLEKALEIYARLEYKTEFSNKIHRLENFLCEESSTTNKKEKLRSCPICQSNIPANEISNMCFSCRRIETYKRFREKERKDIIPKPPKRNTNDCFMSAPELQGCIKKQKMTITQLK